MCIQSIITRISRRAMPETNVSIFCCIMLLASTYGIEELPSTTKTKLEYFTSGVHWNAANAHCNSTRGRLLQYENSRINSYSKYLTKTLSEYPFATSISAWIGIVIKDRNANTFVWTDGCIEVCYEGWAESQPASLYTNFCVSLFFVEASIEPRWLIPKWRNRQCDDTQPGFICEYSTGEPCNYIENWDKKLVPSTDIESELLYNVTESDCENICDTRIKSNKECWGFNYDSTASDCELFYTIGPFDLDDSITDYPGFIAKIRSCFELVWNEKIISSTVTPLLEPQTPCFENFNMSGCFQSVTTADYSSTINNNLDQTTSVEGDVKPSLDTNASTYKWTRETTTRVDRSSISSPQTVYKTGEQLGDSTQAIQTTEITPVPSHPITDEAKQTLTTHLNETPSDSTSMMVTVKTTEITTLSSHGISEEITSVLTTDLNEPQGTTSLTLETTKATNDCVCSCMNPRTKQNVTKEVFTKKLIEDLVIDKQNLSSSVRKKVSVYEHRAIAVTLGTAWVGILLGIYGAVFLSDVIVGGLMMMSKKKAERSRKTKRKQDTEKQTQKY